MPHYPLRVKLFSFLDINFKRFLNIFIALHQGFWLGVLSQDQIDKATELNYLSLEKYRNLNYNKSGLWYWEEQALKSYFKDCNTILVGACGGGREIIALHKIGYKADGFECSEKLVEFCRETLLNENINARVYICPPSEVPEQIDKYDGLIMGWGAYMHIRGRENRINFLKQLHTKVVDESPLLLSFFARDNSKQYERIYNIARFVSFVTRNKDEIELGDTLNGTFDHFFTREEIENELKESGFNLIHYSEGSTYPHAVARAV